MSQHAHIPEGILIRIWKDQSFDKTLFTESGERIDVMYVGDENTETGGPDFINARIKIGNLTYLGDVEIDNTHGDWKNHGHNVNRRFNKVILHAIFNNHSEYKTVLTQDGRKVANFTMAPYIDENILESLKKSVVMEEDTLTHKVTCYKVASFAPVHRKVELLTAMGLDRFRKKCEKLIQRYRELVYISKNTIAEPVFHYHFPASVYETTLQTEDLNKRELWEQLFYEEAFQALGYSQNKNAMHNFAQAVTLDVIRGLGLPRERFITEAELFFFKVSGLLPRPEQVKNPQAVSYIRSAEEVWQKYQPKYRGMCFDNVHWHFSRLRPQNFPTVRLAAGARLAYNIIHAGLISSLSKKFAEIQNISVLRSAVASALMVRGEGYWTNHFTVDKPTSELLHYFLGKNRAEEMMTNVVIPFMYIYFDLFGRKKLSRKALDLYHLMTNSGETGLVREMAKGLQIGDAWTQTIVAQGMIELFRTFCAHDKCTECPIGQLVFSEE